MTNEFAGFSTRARNALVAAGLKTIDEAVLYARSCYWSVEKMPGVGHRTAEEIREKLGVPRAKNYASSRSDWGPLKTMWANALMSYGFETIGQLRGAIQNGEVALSKINGIGKKGEDEIRRLCGIESSSRAVRFSHIKAAITLLERHGYNVTKP